MRLFLAKWLLLAGFKLLPANHPCTLPIMRALLPLFGVIIIKRDGDLS